jgi:outer membrane protein OmpU
MNNFTKIGMTALAASLVSTSVFAGEVTASGSASVTMEGWSGTTTKTSRGLSMADSVYLTVSSELDNGMTVSMSFKLEGGSDADNSFDDHFVSVSSDALGTFKFSGNGGSTAASAIDGTAAGDMWDNFNTANNISDTTGVTVSAAEGGNNSIFYTAPAIVDGLGITASYRPDGSADSTSGRESAIGYGLSYTGVEGLSLSYASADKETGTATSSGTQEVMSASYAYGPVTVAYSNSDYDVGAANTEALKQEVSSYAVSYTVSDAISLTYGSEIVESGLAGSTDAEYEKLSASYTAGGMTVTVTSADGDNISHTTASNEDMEYWALGLSFAF